MNPYAIGFTGSRVNRPLLQMEALHALLTTMRDLGWTTFHHGDCVGADYQAWGLARQWFYTVCHPPLRGTLCSFTVNNERRDSKPFLERNCDIVNETRFLIALPDGPERKRSGTWATVRYARSLGRDGRIIWPDGTVTTL